MSWPGSRRQTRQYVEQRLTNMVRCYTSDNEAAPTLFGLCIERLHRSNSAKTARRQAHSFGLGHNAVYKWLKDLCNMAGWMSEVLVSILRWVRFPHIKDILVGTQRPAAQAAATYVRDSSRHCALWK